MSKKLNEMTQVAAFRIVNALRSFDTVSSDLRHQAEQITMARVQHMRNGDPFVIDGADLIKEIVDAG